MGCAVTFEWNLHFVAAYAKRIDAWVKKIKKRFALYLTIRVTFGNRIINYVQYLYTERLHEVQPMQRYLCLYEKSVIGCKLHAIVGETSHVLQHGSRPLIIGVAVTGWPQWVTWLRLDSGSRYRIQRLPSGCQRQWCVPHSVNLLANVRHHFRRV